MQAVRILSSSVFLFYLPQHAAFIQVASGSKVAAGAPINKYIPGSKMKEGEKSKKHTTVFSSLKDLSPKLQCPVTTHWIPLTTRDGRNYSHLIRHIDAWNKTRVLPYRKTKECVQVSDSESLPQTILEKGKDCGTVFTPFSLGVVAAENEINHSGAFTGSFVP